jgi:putative addiction module antidote
MMLELKLRKVGNSVGVVLPKEVLAHLNVCKGDTVLVTEAPDGSLQISRHKVSVARQKAVVKDVMKRYQRTMRALAK